MKTRNDTRAGLMALSLLLSPLVSLNSELAKADEFMKWERIPLQIPLQVGLERVVFVDKNVRVGFPPALNGKLRVQSTGGAVYLKADSAFPQTRVQLQDVESGEVILLDVTAGEKGPSEPVRLVYSGEVNTVSSTADTRRQAENSSIQPGSDDGTQAKRKKVQYSAPVPVLLTRYAAQSLYAPLRTVEAVPGIRPVNPHLPKRLTTLYPSEAITATPLAAWGVANRAVVAVRLQNTASRRIVLDPRALQGQFVAATFQHRWLGPVGTPEDTTTAYIVTGTRPESAFIAEPSPMRKVVHTAKKGVNHAD
ncbi:TIGR03749 family integrating conjugative element protein [Cronobacter sakazakii]|uniref:TIGR03749 family integrating conjugative element protein n=1 Tax=Enterobacteriaceae TaxID=543 RepID=UPI000BE90D76|nr:MULTISPECIES: TIGR03749 family integrating conjugative element protein [Enterobacteriaceae]EAA7350413.1 TIGR03749 family integrating conjugative element protein [Salmonella enterica subsp. enterica]EBH3588691.1 TIGR03749 family integrating conjugative element protein [Salmonella enterica subsp. enterica serovar Kottbus]EGP4118856.1 TIGR03749 family integrating conjugative element protein [Salmonella enterica]EDT8807995.1 TIGR03749 family integrating conjugative element protein [Salmonella en